MLARARYWLIGRYVDFYRNALAEAYMYWEDSQGRPKSDYDISELFMWKLADATLWWADHVCRPFMQKFVLSGPEDEQLWSYICDVI